MAYARVGDEFPRQYRAAGPHGRDFLICALTYCNEHGTDGRIDYGDIAHVAPGQRYPYKVADQLVALGLFKRTATGYLIAAEIYREFNLFKADLEALRKGWTASKSRRRRAPLNVHSDIERTSSALRAHSESANVHGGHDPQVPAPIGDGPPGERQCPPIPIPIPLSIRGEGDLDARAREAEQHLQVAKDFEQLGWTDLATKRRELARALGRHEGELPATEGRGSA